VVVGVEIGVGGTRIEISDGGREVVGANVEVWKVKAEVIVELERGGSD
jgi:hypothetical protein